MPNKNTPFWMEFCKSIVIPALIPVALGFGSWLFASKYNEAQIRNSTADLVLKASHNLSSDDPIKCISALTVLETIVREEETLKKTRAMVKKVQSNNIRMIARSDTEKAAGLYEILKENNLVDKNFDELVGKDTITRVGRYAEARKFELEGFRHLIERKYEEAINSFEKAEDRVPRYHWVFEIARLLRQKLPGLKVSSPEVADRTRKEVLSTILQKYSAKAPQDFLDKAREEVKLTTAFKASAQATFEGEVTKKPPPADDMDRKKNK